jgi:two-component system, NtrC family, response regulator AtoC
VKDLLLIVTVIRDGETRSCVRTTLEESGHRVIQADGCTQAHLLLINGLSPDLLLVEMQEAGSAELSHYRELLKIAPGGIVCTIEGPAENGTRVDRSQSGVRCVLNKPVLREDIERIIARLKDPTEDVTYGDVNRSAALSVSSVNNIAADMPLGPYIEELGRDRFFLAASPAMMKIHRQVQLLANVDAPVLILGESGTGKEIIAHLIHKHSRRSAQKFLNVNCAALPADLLESELFGYTRGAFTGAIKDKPGKFEQVNRGTLLLDEIGEMSAQMQAKLLHVLQDGQYTRLGARECSRADVRVLAATNVQIESALEAKTFREDLFYRLSVFTINVPPLRERPQEIPYLIEEMIRRSPAEMCGGRDFDFPARLMDAALHYDWRGNVRELRNFVTRTITMRDPDTALQELEKKIASADEVVDQKESGGVGFPDLGMRSIMRGVKDRTEAQLIQNALELSGWNRRHAAKYLNISYRGLLYKIQQLGLTPKLPRGVAAPSRSSLLARGNAS